MPIGKNAIKRVSNNGYSKVQTAAPDMENSVVEEPKTKKVEKKEPVTKTVTQKKATEKKPSTKKSTAAKKPAPKKSMETEPELSPVKTLEKVTSEPSREGEGYVNLGGALPVHLL